MNSEELYNEVKAIGLINSLRIILNVKEVTLTIKGKYLKENEKNEE